MSRNVPVVSRRIRFISRARSLSDRTLSIRVTRRTLRSCTSGSTSSQIAASDWRQAWVAGVHQITASAWGRIAFQMSGDMLGSELPGMSMKSSRSRIGASRKTRTNCVPSTGTDATSSSAISVSWPSLSTTIGSPKPWVYQIGGTCVAVTRTGEDTRPRRTLASVLLPDENSPRMATLGFDPVAPASGASDIIINSFLSFSLAPSPLRRACASVNAVALVSVSCAMRARSSSSRSSA
jgi:hypothetical protein